MLSPIVDNVYASRGGKTGIVVPVHGSRPPGGYCVCPVVVGSDGVLNNQIRFNFRRPGDLPADVLSVDFSDSDSIFSLGVTKLLACNFSIGVAGPTAGVSCFRPAPSSVGSAAAALVFALPRMIGKPSLPLPMITSFEFVDCASCSVASIPRHRK